MIQGQKILVFTDLDGTLLDHHNYDHAPAQPAVERLIREHIPIIPVTSKTMVEIDALGLPFTQEWRIAENGNVISGPEGEVACVPYSVIIDFVACLPPDLRRCVRGFNDMDIQDVINHTSLTEPSAILAKQRMASEPFLWSGDDEMLDRLKYLALERDIALTQGGRFYHFISSNGGKDKAVRAVVAHYKDKYPDHQIISIALGDGPNDSAMLACVDYGVRIPNENGHSFEIDKPEGYIIDASEPGPRGWNASINTLLDELHSAS